MERWTAKAAGGTSQRLKPVPAMMCSRSRKDMGLGVGHSFGLHRAYVGSGSKLACNQTAVFDLAWRYDDPLLRNCVQRRPIDAQVRHDKFRRRMSQPLRE